MLGTLEDEKTAESVEKSVDLVDLVGGVLFRLDPDEVIDRVDDHDHAAILVDILGGKVDLSHVETAVIEKLGKRQRVAALFKILLPVPCGKAHHGGLALGHLHYGGDEPVFALVAPADALLIIDEKRLRRQHLRLRAASDDYGAGGDIRRRGAVELLEERRVLHHVHAPDRDAVHRLLELFRGGVDVSHVVVRHEKVGLLRKNNVDIRAHVRNVFPRPLGQSEYRLFGHVGVPSVP